MISYLGKTKFKDACFMRVFFNGAVVSVPITKEEYDEINLDFCQQMNISDFVIECYNKGYDAVLLLRLNRKGA